MTTFTRRTLLLSSLVSLAACQPKNAAATDATRCAFCGMKIDPKSPFRAQIDSAASGSATAAVSTGFDSPRCALARYFAKGAPDAHDTVRVQEFYSREWRSGADVVFVLGSDVIGPMGNDAIPVDRAHATQFLHDHPGAGVAPTRVRELSAITLAEIQSL